MIAPNEKLPRRRPAAGKLEALYEKLAEAYGPLDLVRVQDTLDRALFAMVAEQLPLSSTLRAYQSFKTGFVDWNEIRISPAKEVQEVLQGAAEPLELALSMKDFLQVLFNNHHHLGLEFLREKNLSEIRSFFKKHTRLGEASVALMLEHLKDHPVLPVDTAVQPFFKKAGVLKGATLSAQEHKDLHAEFPREHLLGLYTYLQEHTRQGLPALTRRKAPRTADAAAAE